MSSADYYKNSDLFGIKTWLCYGPQWTYNCHVILSYVYHFLAQTCDKTRFGILKRTALSPSWWEWRPSTVSWFLIVSRPRHRPLSRLAILRLFCCVRYLWEALPRMPGIYKLTFSFYAHCIDYSRGDAYHPARGTRFYLKSPCLKSEGWSSCPRCVTWAVWSETIGPQIQNCSPQTNDYVHFLCACWTHVKLLYDVFQNTHDWKMKSIRADCSHTLYARISECSLMHNEILLCKAPLLWLIWSKDYTHN